MARFHLARSASRPLIRRIIQDFALGFVSCWSICACTRQRSQPQGGMSPFPPQVHQQLEAPHSLDSTMPSVLLPQPEVDLRSPGVQHPCRHHCIPMHGFLLHCGLVQLDHLRSLGRSSGLDLEGTNHRRDKSKFGGSSSEHHRFCDGRVKIRTWIEGNAYVATNHYLIDEAVLQ